MTGRLPEEIERLNVNGQVVQVLSKPLNLDRLQDLLWVTLEGFPDAEIAPVHWSGRAIVQEVRESGPPHIPPGRRCRA